MTAEVVSAVASVGTLLVILATAVAAFVQLRHLSVTNSVAVVNAFREEYERLQAPAFEALPGILERLREPAARRELMSGNAAFARPLFPMMRLMETLGNYTNRKIVPRDLVCDQWAPVILSWWKECGPIIAIVRRENGPSFLEHWEAIAVMSERWIDEDRRTYPKGLPRIGLVDPWPEDGVAAPE